MSESAKYPVVCPRCKAAVGDPCRSCMGNPTLTHVPRIKAAQAQGLTCWMPSAFELGKLRDAEAKS